MATFFFGCTQQTKKDVKEDGKLPQLKVSENQRYLMDEDENPFFWLGDTGWLLFSKLNRAEAEEYLDNRVEKGFNVIQVMVVHHLAVSNVYGDSALVKGDISIPALTEGNIFEDTTAYDFWDHADYIIDLAEKKGLYMALVPVWGTNVKEGGISRQQADIYSSWLAKRYAEKSNIIWLNGGDTKGCDSTATWNIMGQNYHKLAPNHLTTFHPFGRMQSSLWFHNAQWLDFNMFQSGHRRYDQDDTEKAYGQDNYKYVTDDLATSPLKPTIDGEPSYEGIPQGLHDPTEPFWNDNDLRRYAYWSVFAGGFGFTYGNSAVMQMSRPIDETPAYGVREYWTEAIDMPGARQMVHLKKLLLSKPYFERIPDQSLIAAGQGEKYDYQVATRGKNYALIYTHNGREMQISMGKIAGDKVAASWFNPRNGKQTVIGKFENNGTHTFNPPGEMEDGNDWVLILDSVE